MLGGSWKVEGRAEAIAQSPMMGLSGFELGMARFC